MVNFEGLGVQKMPRHPAGYEYEYMVDKGTWSLLEHRHHDNWFWLTKTTILI